MLEVSVPRYLDSSLIDVDIHPHYVSIVIKGKVRLLLTVVTYFLFAPMLRVTETKAT